MQGNVVLHGLAPDFRAAAVGLPGGSPGAYGTDRDRDEPGGSSSVAVSTGQLRDVDTASGRREIARKQDR